MLASKRRSKTFPISVIDIFAGPGGLSEGFACFDAESIQQVFKVDLSVEKEANAHQTLLLRSFFRQFPKGKVPHEYYQYLYGQIKREELFGCYPEQAAVAYAVSLRAELGNTKDSTIIHDRIAAVVDGSAGKPWVLVGDPPCQVYSVIGRSRMRNHVPKFLTDVRHTLYEHYSEIITEFTPEVPIEY